MTSISGQIVAWAIALAFVGSLLVVLWSTFRFSITSPCRTQGSTGRLRHPEIDKVAKEWGIPIPAGLEDWYRDSDFVERSDFYLQDSRRKTWYIHQCIPLTVIDQREWIKITGVPGLPIAHGGDDDKSTYYLPFQSLKESEPVPIMMHQTLSPNTIKVADSIEEFGRFQYVEFSDEDDRLA